MSGTSARGNVLHGVNDPDRKRRFPEYVVRVVESDLEIGVGVRGQPVVFDLKILAEAVEHVLAVLVDFFGGRSGAILGEHSAGRS